MLRCMGSLCNGVLFAVTFADHVLLLFLEVGFKW